MYPGQPRSSEDDPEPERVMMAYDILSRETYCPFGHRHKKYVLEGHDFKNNPDIQKCLDDKIKCFLGKSGL